MTQLTMPNPQDLQGQVLYDVGGEGIGVIEGVYLDNVTRDPEWAAVRLGPDRLALIPLGEASVARGGIRVEFDREMVLAAPFHLTALDNEVTEDTEQLLLRYYTSRGTRNGSKPAVVEEAQEALDTAKEEAAEVTAVVGDEAAGLAWTARSEATDLAGTAKEEAAEVAASAKEHATEVAEAAKDQASAVVEQAREEAAEVAEVATAEGRAMVETTRTELEIQAEIQIRQIADSLHRLAGQSLALARGNADQAGQLGDLVRRAGEELQTVAGGIEERGSAGLLSATQRVVRQRPKAAIFGTALAVVAGARLMGTPAGERLKEKIAPLKEQAIEAGRSVAEELKPIAQQRAEHMKATVTSAADQVKQEAQGAVADVKGTAEQSTKNVKTTAKRSADTVKGTAKQSAARTKNTAKRTARAAAPVA